jgi:Cu/Ag efflux pump CusA
MNDDNKTGNSLISIRAAVVLALSLAVGVVATALCMGEQELSSALMAGGAATGSALIVFNQIIGGSSRSR